MVNIFIREQGRGMSHSKLTQIFRDAESAFASKITDSFFLLRCNSYIDSYRSFSVVHWYHPFSDQGFKGISHCGHMTAACVAGNTKPMLATLKDICMEHRLMLLNGIKSADFYKTVTGSLFGKILLQIFEKLSGFFLI